jgi:sulfate transport system ATP-binding protein
LEEKSIEVGETVDVFLYRLFVTSGEKAMLLENKSLVDDSVFI